MDARKKAVFYMVLVVVSVFIVYGCITTTQGPATTLRTTQGFVPKKTYNLGYDQMWDKMMSVLRAQRIMLSQSSKESGIIQTDYIHGWETDIAAISKTTYRYKYQIAFEKINPSQTRVEITCKIEAKEFLKGGSAREAVEQLRPYEDVTHKQQQNAMFFENWLYEQIEKSL
ncbi:MAG: outer membrane protein assembly factor BamC [Nitrospirae bacterium]|nr:outer membrane protein assembly factor BamC [Nitrospirota bacterium]MDA8214167.1 outer membrane protein assembly factor BamC [Nitrospiraceae bacterium]MDA8338338.1 outer membrane protein assembly factor BamC [Nitrospiraceae bacterium]